MIKLRVAICAVFLLVFSISAKADLMTSPVNLNISGLGCSGSGSCSIDGLALGIPATTTKVHVTGSASDSASYGAVSAVVKWSSSGPTCCGGGGDAMASFSDSLDITGYSGSGFVEYQFNGVINFASSDVPGKATINGSQVTLFAPNGPYPFTAGTGFTINVFADAFLADSAGDGGGQDVIQLTLADILVFDSNMNPISGYTLTSGSGTVYPAVGAAPPIPEPSCISLFLTVILGSAWIARKRLRRA